MRAHYALFFCLLTGLALGACESDDIGRRCEPEGGIPRPTEPVAGEDSVVEVVSLQRDGACESFQCLTHRGLPPYCTRECSYEAQKGKACTSDADCSKPDHCFEGFCRDDDCPQGFVCGRVQDVGPNAGRLFCLRKEGCASNIDCENLGEVSCQQLACTDERLLTNDPAASPMLMCVPRSEVPYCVCPGNSESCTDADLICDPPDAPAWPRGAVQQRSACQRKEP